MRRRTYAIVILTVLFAIASDGRFSAQDAPRLSLVFSQRFADGAVEGMAVDSAGSIWVVGGTRIASVPVTPDAMQPTAPGWADIFLGRLRPDGTILYMTYLGGARDDSPRDIALDAAGNIYITGITSSGDFPTTPGALDTTCGADGSCTFNDPFLGPVSRPDTFVMKLAPDGRSLIYSTYLGGSETDFANGLAVDNAGRAHVVGTSRSADMPRTAGAVRIGNGRSDDAFYARLSADGSALEYATNLGGSRGDDGADLALDAAGNAYLTGGTKSPDFTLFRAMKSAFPSTANGQAWLAKFNPSGLEFSTFLGGSGNDTASTVAVSGSGVFVAGTACSVDLPGAPRSKPVSDPCDQTAYVMKITTEGSAVVLTALLDGAGVDWAHAIAVDANDLVWVTGSTNSADFPVTADAAQRTGGGSAHSSVDAIFAAIPMADGASGTPAYATYLGGRQNVDFASEVQRDGRGGAFIGGQSSSPDFPTVNGGAPSPSEEGMAFLAHFAAALPPAEAGEVVLYARDATTVQGAWELVVDASAAGGARLWNPDAGVPKITTPAAAPSSYFELTFEAEANVPFHLWLRMKADNDHWTNDSVYVQFSDSVDANGAAIWRIGSTSATFVSLEDCVNCGEQGWGWNDNGYAVAAQPVVFATSGTHTLRIQQREDGISIDQVVLSSATYISAAPGTAKNDSTILPPSSGTPDPPPTSDSREVVLYVAADRSAGGENWQSVADATAAGGARLLNPDQGVPKLSSPTAAGNDYFEVQFTAEAGVPYHLWVRSRATDDHWMNDSVFVQFSGSVDASGSPTFRIGSGQATIVSLEDCGGCGEQGWGWNDNAYGFVADPIYFATSGPQTIRVLRREDGISIDQIVLSAGTYLNAAPGAAKNDTTIVPK